MRTDQNTTSKAKRAAFDATEKHAKQDDRSKFDTGLTGFCNKYLFISFKRSTKNEIFRVDENTWLVKRNHGLYPTTVEYDLGKAHAYCQSLLDAMNKNIDESTDSSEKNALKAWKKKMLDTIFVMFFYCTKTKFGGFAAPVSISCLSAHRTRELLRDFFASRQNPFTCIPVNRARDMTYRRRASKRRRHPRKKFLYM